MAGIYIHVPFCRQACLYCGFHFSTGMQHRGEMVEALGRELVLQRDFFAETPLPGNPIETVYLGGGTPSVLDASELETLLNRVRTVFPLQDDVEITLEANPDDIGPERLQSWKAAGINRLSVGIQSFFAEDLAWMNRAHDAIRAAGCLQEMAAAGFARYSCDLIYGYPLLTDDKWRANIDRMIAAGVPHLSCYAMTVEPHTPLEHFIRTRKSAPMDDDQAARQFRILTARLTAAGYEPYEISNFAKPGCRSRHNSHYWDETPYLGIGPSAHSFRGDIRQWNVSNNALYVKSIAAGTVPFEQEHLTPVMRLNEYLMTSLRTMEGCDLERISGRWGNDARTRLEKEAGIFLRTGKMIREGSRLVLTAEGRLFADGIAAELFGRETD